MTVQPSITSQVLNGLEVARQKMRERSKGVGQPCIELPVEEVSVVMTSGPRLFMTIDNLIGVVNNLMSEAMAD